MSDANIPVLIVGAGPTGLTLALELSLQHIPFRLVEAGPQPSDKSRALIIHPRTQELLNRHVSVTRELIEAGTVGLGAAVYVKRKEAVSVNLEDIGVDDSAFGPPLWVSQVETEASLQRKLEEYGGHVERGIKAEKVTQDNEGVTVELVKPNGTKEELRATYVIGCDGAHSIVRHAANLSFKGDRYPQHFILCDAKLDGDYSANQIKFFLGKRVMVMFPMKDGYVRLIGQRLSDETNDPTIEEFQKLVDEMAPAGWKVHSPFWLAHFQFHHRGVNAYRAGRLFVAGDAAHIHSPAGGQGMNTGIQDVVNLGWKLGKVLREEAGEKLLDSYNAERRLVGDHLLHGTDRIFRVVSSTNPVWTLLRNFLLPKVLPWVVSNKARRARGFRFLSELGIRYRRSPVVGTAEGFEGPLRGGNRAPDGVLRKGEEEKQLLELCSPSAHTLLLFAGTEGPGLDESVCTDVEARLKAMKAYGDTQIVRVSCEEDDTVYLDKDGIVHGRYGMRTSGYVLVRPDYYVAHIGASKELDKLTEWLGPQIN